MMHPIVVLALVVPRQLLLNTESDNEVMESEAAKEKTGLNM